MSNTGWTAQSPQGFIHSDGEPGQTFTKEQLPDPEQQRKGGVDPDLWRNPAHGLWIDEELEDSVEE
jgi:hypothetical protein